MLLIFENPVEFNHTYITVYIILSGCFFSSGVENQDPLEKIVNEVVDASWKEKMAFS